MTPTSDNEIIELITFEIAGDDDEAEYCEAVARRVFAIAEPLITKRAEEAVLRKMLAYSKNSERTGEDEGWELAANEHGFQETLRRWLKARGRGLGIDLEGDGNG